MNRFIATIFALAALAFAPLAHAQYVPPASGWKLLGSTTLSGTSSVEFTSSTIGNSSELLFVMKNVFCGSSTFSSYLYIGNSGGSTTNFPNGSQTPLCNASTGLSGNVIFSTVQNDTGIAWGALGTFGGTVESKAAGWASADQQVTPWKVVGGLKLVRFTIFGDTFTSGTVELYGR